MKKLRQESGAHWGKRRPYKPIASNIETKKESGIAENAIENRGEPGVDSLGTSFLPSYRL
jgi:hypothetical protein